MNETSFSAWVQFLGAVQWLGRVARPGLTPTEALEEAIRWWVVGAGDPEFGNDSVMPASVDDPLGATVGAWLTGRSRGVDPMPTSVGLEAAITNWTAAMGVEHNDGKPWPHPSPSAGWPAVSS